MAKKIRLTESELKKVIKHSVNTILREMDEFNPAGPVINDEPATVPNNIEEIIANGIINGGTIDAEDGENEHEVGLDDGTTAIIHFTVDYRPGMPNHPSSSYEEDQTGLDDDYSIVVDEVYWYDDNGEEHKIEINTDIITKAIEKVVDVEYNGDRDAYWDEFSR